MSERSKMDEVTVGLTENDVQVLLQALLYAQQRILDSKDSTADLRVTRLEQLEALASKLRAVR